MSRVLLGLAGLAVLKLGLLAFAAGLLTPVPDAGVSGRVALESGPAAAPVAVPAVIQAMGVAEAQAQAAPAANTPDPNAAPAAEAAPPAGMDPADWKALKAREEQLAAKERSLKALEASLDDKLAEMQKLQKELNSMLEQAQAIKDEKVKHLVDVYANMKAKQAAAVLETLEPDLAVKILSGMKGRQAGEVLSFVEPVKAAKLSEMLTNMQIPFQQ
ncbi:MAG: MotE family protein [Desulfovibrionaceae bacterium]